MGSATDDPDVYDPPPPPPPLPLPPPLPPSPLPGRGLLLPPRGVTPTIRYNHPPHFRLYFLGFRCAQSP